MLILNEDLCGGLSGRRGWCIHKNPLSICNIYLEPVFPHHVEKNIDFFPPSKSVIEQVSVCVWGGGLPANRMEDMHAVPFRGDSV